MKRIRVPILTEQYAINVFIGKRKDVMRAAKKYCGPRFDFQMEGRRGMAIDTLNTSDPKHPLICIDGDLPADTGLATLAHEASHAMDYLIDYIGILDRSGEFRGHGIAAVMRAVTKLFLKKK